MSDIKVEKLEWKKHKYFEKWMAWGLSGHLRYEIRTSGGGISASCSNFNRYLIGSTFLTIEKAKAAAQTHYEKIILEALE